MLEKRLRSHFVNLVVILLGLVLFAPLTITVANQLDAISTLTYGFTIQDAIGVVGDVGEYTFAANAGDIVLVRMSRTSGSVNPYIEILNSEGTQLCYTYQYTTFAEIKSCTLPETASYTLRAKDKNDMYTGSYALYLQRLNAPGNTSTSNFGTTESDAITSAAQLNTYTFDAYTGDSVAIHVTTTSGVIDPHIRIFDPNGMPICQTSDIYSPVFLDGCIIAMDGTYTILIGDYMGVDVGIYNMYIQRVTNPVGSAILLDSTVDSGTVTAAAALEAYTFTGAVGDVLLVRAAPTSAGGLDPEMRIYDPNGTRICSGYDAYDKIAEISTCTLAATGTYTLLIGDFGGFDVGNYDVYMVRLSSPSVTFPLTYGEINIGAAEKPASVDVYTFQGAAGEVIVGQVGVPDSSFDPHLRIYGTDGGLVCQDVATTQYSQDAVYVHCIVPSDQEYLAVVGTYDAYSRLTTGTYQLELQRLNLPVGSSMLQLGMPVNTSINPAGEWDTYTFNATSGDVVNINMTASTGTIDPHIRLFGTDGVYLCGDYDYSTYSDANAEIASCTLPFNGTYTLLASSHWANKIGYYTLNLACDGVCGITVELNEKIYVPISVMQ